MKHSFKGKNNPMWGKHHTVKTKRKISKAKTGKIHSEETKRLWSRQRKGIKKSEEHKRNIGISHLGIRPNKKTRKKLGRAQRKRFQNPLEREKYSKMFSGEKHPKFRKLLPKKQIEQMRERMLNGGAMKALRGNRRPSKLQKKLFRYIKGFYPEAILDYSIKLWDGKYYLLDIAIPELKLDFEYDGKYWHSINNREVTDFFRDENLIERGWCVVRVKGQEELKALLQGGECFAGKMKEVK